jgi:hypothetical protein
MYKVLRLLCDPFMATMTVSDFRQNLVSAVETSMVEAVMVQRHGKTIGVFLRPEVYEELLAAWDDLVDLRALREARAEGGSSIPWEQVKAELGW